MLLRKLLMQKIKAFKASFCGVVDKRFFLYGLQRVYA